MDPLSRSCLLMEPEVAELLLFCGKNVNFVDTLAGLCYYVGCIIVVN